MKSDPCGRIGRRGRVGRHAEKPRRSGDPIGEALAHEGQHPGPACCDPCMVSQRNRIHTEEGAR
jgi:hypothetical protein